LPITHWLVAEGSTLWFWASYCAILLRTRLRCIGAIFHGAIRNSSLVFSTVGKLASSFTLFRWWLLATNLAIRWLSAHFFTLLRILLLACAIPSARWLAVSCLFVGKVHCWCLGNFSSIVRRIYLIRPLYRPPAEICSCRVRSRSLWLVGQVTARHRIFAHQLALW